MKWTDSLDVALALIDRHPDVDPTRINFVDLTPPPPNLPGFDPPATHCGEKKLEAIQQAWMDEAE